MLEIKIRRKVNGGLKARICMNSCEPGVIVETYHVYKCVSVVNNVHCDNYRNEEKSVGGCVPDEKWPNLGMYRNEKWW